MLESKLKGVVAKVLPFFISYNLVNAVPVFSQPNSDSMHHFMAGNLYRKGGDLDKAFRSYLKALEHDPESAYLNNSIGETLIQEDRLDFALFYLKNAVKLDKKFIDARKNLAGVYILKDNFHKALRHASFVLSKNPEDSRALSYAGESLFHLKNFPEASKYFEKVVSLRKDQADCMSAYHRLGMIKYYGNNFRPAIEDFERSIILIDEDNLADRLVAYRSIFLITSCHYFLEEYVEAKESLNSLLLALSQEKESSLVNEMLDDVKKHKLIWMIEDAIQSSSKKETPSTAIPK